MTWLSNEDVRRLDVTVNDSSGVSGIESVGDFDGQRQQNLDLHRAAGDAML